ncbi:MAG: cysteine hydrolase [Proteobacteria bacterium]|nr:cysteine hydrolase [Pseudomonadota bacterium]
MSLDQFSAHRRNEAEFRFSPHNTAVLVIDMLNDFCVEGGAMVLPGSDRLLGPQNAVITAVRDAGGVVVFIIDSHRPNLRRDREYLMRERHCVEGTWGAEVIAGLDQKAEDLRILKRRYSGFFNTDLDLTLKDMEVDTIIAMGVVTNICVRSTVHDAFFHGYRVVVPEDCVAATGPREQDSSLYDIGTHFGVVSISDDVVHGLTGGAPIENRIVD